ncbi:MAG: alpha-amylase family glycosyl hydrolase [Succinivibrionaceae bacterium]
MAGLVSVAMSLTACGGGGGSSGGSDDPDPSTGKLTPKLSSSCLKMDGDTEAASGTCFDWSSSATNDYFVKLIKSVTEEFKIDAWRFDQAYQVPLANWKNVTDTLKNTAYNSLIQGFSVAEVWDGDGKYIEMDALKDGALESAFNFPLRYKLLQVIAGQENTADSFATRQPAAGLAGEWGYGNFIRYTNHNVMPTMFVDNHDLVRLGNLLFRYGYVNESNVASEDYSKIHLLSFAFMGAYSGPITIYYGSEYGDYTKGFSTELKPCGTGTQWCDDHVSRTQMKTSGFARWQEKLRSNVKKIMDLRKANDALYNGQRFHIYSTSNTNARGDDISLGARDEPNFYVDVKKSNRDGKSYVYVMSTSTADRSLRLSEATTKYLCDKAVGSHVCSLKLVMDTAAEDVTHLSPVIMGGSEFVFNLSALSAQYYEVSDVSGSQISNDYPQTTADNYSDRARYDDTVNSFACFRGENPEKCKLIIYQVMVEAAPNGPDAAGKGSGWGPSEHKGTLGGIEGSLDFIQGSGANALWITPVFKTSHSTDEAHMKTDGTGYFATSHWKGDAATIDDDFGGASALKSLINEVHNRDMYFILDGVLGHGKADMNADTTYFNVE